MRLYDLPSDIVSISCLDTTGRVYSGKVARTHPTTLTETGNDGPFDIDWDRARTLVRDYGAVDLVFEVCIWPPDATSDRAWMSVDRLRLRIPEQIDGLWMKVRARSLMTRIVARYTGPAGYVSEVLAR